MTGPKRGITFACSVLVEFDMRIKKGKEEDDVQLISFSKWSIILSSS